MARAGIAAVEPSADPADDVPVLHASIYEELRTRLITGKIVPGLGLSTRGLAAELGVSQMPVRDALSRLAAEGAVEVASTLRCLQLEEEEGPKLPDWGKIGTEIGRAHV